MDGLIRVRKPEGLTSHDVVARLRRILGEKKIGHCGTLDPLASGLLLATVGKATRLFPFLSRLDKCYRSRIELGYSTDSYDREGRRTSEDCAEFPTADAVREALRGFQGDISQNPPPFSAKKVRGKPLYAYARRRQAVSGLPIRIRIHALTIEAYRPPFLDLNVVCSSGTYIRTLAHDLGNVLGCRGHLAALERTRIGPYLLENAFSPDEIRTFHERAETSRFLLPMTELLPEFPSVVLSRAGVERVRHGRPIDPGMTLPAAGTSRGGAAGGIDVIRLFDEDGTLIALARAAGAESWTPFLVFL